MVVKTKIKKDSTIELFEAYSPFLFLTSMVLYIKKALIDAGILRSFDEQKVRVEMIIVSTSNDNNTPTTKQ